MYEEWKDTKQGKKWDKLNKEAQPDRRGRGQPKDTEAWQERWSKIDSEGRPPVQVMRDALAMDVPTENIPKGKPALFRMWTEQGFKVLEDGRTGKGKRKTAVTELSNSEMRDYLSTRIANSKFRGKSKKGLFELYIKEKKREAEESD